MLDASFQAGQLVVGCFTAGGFDLACHSPPLAGDYVVVQVSAPFVCSIRLLIPTLLRQLDGMSFTVRVPCSDCQTLLWGNVTVDRAENPQLRTRRQCMCTRIDRYIPAMSCPLLREAGNWICAGGQGCPRLAWARAQRYSHGGTRKQVRPQNRKRNSHDATTLQRNLADAGRDDGNGMHARDRQVPGGCACGVKRQLIGRTPMPDANGAPKGAPFRYGRPRSAQACAMRRAM